MTLASRFFVSMLAISAFFFCRSARADILYQTGFESPFTLGNVNGQQGWSYYGSVSPGVIENTVYYAGTQALEFDDSTTSGENGNGIELSGDYNSNTDSDQIVQVSIEAYFTGDSEEVWDALSAFSSVGFLGQIVVNGPDAEFSTTGIDGSVPITFNTWNLYTLVFNYSTEQVLAYYNSTLIGSGAFASPSSTDLLEVAVGYNNKPGVQTDTSYFDNLDVEDIAPEPASWGLAGAALLGMVWFGRRRARRLKCSRISA